MNKHKIMIVGDSPYLDTGFSLIVRDLSTAFYEAGYEVTNIGLWDPRPNEKIMSFGKYTFPWPVYICRPPFARYAHGPYINILEDIKPTLVILITDIWHAHHFMNNAIPSLYYFHVEGEPVPETTLGSEKMTITWPEILLRNKKVIFGGPFGKTATFDRIGKYVKKNNIDIDIEKLKTNWPVIPDGINLQQFKPLQDKPEFKKVLGLKPDDMLIGFFSRMNARKGLPYALEAFAKWPNRPDNVYFYCHCAIKDKDGWNLGQMIEDLGIEKKVIVNPKLKVGQGVSVEELNRLYNACDLVVSPSLGEGFGQTTCFAPGTLVKTKNGYANIEDIKEGEMVATHKGRYRKVLAVYKSYYKGNMMKISTDATPSFVVTLTHRLLGIKKDVNESNKSFGYEAIELKPGDILKYPVVRDDEDKNLKEFLKKKPIMYSEDRSLIFKYRDILLGSGSSLINIISRVKEKWKIRILRKKYPYKMSCYEGPKGGIKYILSKITKTKISKYKGYIYNFHVDQDSSFLVNGVVAAHNCQALAAGVPVIITDYSELSQFTKGTLKLKPIAFYVDTVTNIKRALPSVDDIVKFYQKVYNREIEHLKSEAREGVEQFDWEKIKKVWLDLVDSIPIIDMEKKFGYTPQLDKWIYENKEPSMPVSIIICSKEKTNLLRQCVDSIRKYTTGKYEVIIHDTGSSSAEALQYLNIISQTPNFRVFRSKLSTFNFSVANNNVAKYAKYDTLLFLNNDTIANPGWLSELKKVLQDRTVGIVGPKLIFSNKTIQHAGVMVGNNGIACHIHIGKPFDYVPANYTREVTAVTGACLMIKRELFEKVGKFDPKFIIEFQDVDLCMKVRALGYKVIYAHNSIMYHLAGQTRGNTPMNEAYNDRPIFVNRWMKELLQGDQYTPLIFNNPYNTLLLDYWKNPTAGDMK